MQNLHRRDSSDVVAVAAVAALVVQDAFVDCIRFD